MVNLKLAAKPVVSNLSLPNFKILADSLYAHTNKDVLVEQLKSNIFIMSEPLFFRDNHYCVFYFEVICGNICGSNNLALYILNGDKWIKTEEYSSWIK